MSRFVSTWFIVLLLLPIAVAQTPSLDVPAEVTPFVPFTVEYEGLESMIGPERVAGGDFTDAGAWHGRTSEVGGDAQAVVRDGVLVLGADRAPTRGSLYASQTVHRGDGEVWELSYRGREQGADPAQVQILLREHADGRNVDTRIDHRLEASWQAYHWSWEPQTTNATVTLYMRVIVDEGDSAEAWFDDVSLRAIPRIEWSGTAALIDAQGRYATFEAPGTGTYSISASAAHGAQTWTAQAMMEAVNAPPTVCLATPTEVVLHVPVVLDASCSHQIDARVALEDPGFGDLGRAWRTSGSQETGGSIIWAVESGDLVARLNGANKTGTLYASQTLQDPGERLDFAVTVSDNGQMDRYRFLVREYNATSHTDTEFHFPPASEPTRLAWTWTPKLPDTQRINLYLRFEAGPGQDAEVHFRDPVVLSGLDFEWMVDGVRTPGTDAQLAHTFRQPGEHTVQVQVRDDDGAGDMQYIRFQVHDPALVFRVIVPEVQPLGGAVPWDASRSQPSSGSLDLLANGDFASGTDAWTLRSREIGAEATQHVLGDEEPFLRIQAEAEQAGSIYLRQAVGPACREVACWFSMAYRVPEGEAILQTLLRSKVDGQTQDHAIAGETTREWRHVEAIWEPDIDSTGHTVYPRFLMGNGTSATMDVRDIRLEPLRQFAWTATGPSETTRFETSRPMARLNEPGHHHVTLTITDPWGNHYATERTLEVAPVHVFRTVHGELGLQYEATPEPYGVMIDAGQTWSQSLQQPLSPLAPGLTASNGGTQVLVDDGRSSWRRVTFQTGDAESAFVPAELLRDGTPPVDLGDPALTQAPGKTRATFQASVSDLSISRLEVRLIDAGTPAASFVLDTSGGFSKTIRLPTTASDRNYTIEVIAYDVFDRATPLPGGSLKVPADQAYWTGILTATLLSILVVGGLLVRLAKAKKVANMEGTRWLGRFRLPRR